MLFLFFVFENYVNYAGSKTATVSLKAGTKFENYVNYAGSKTQELKHLFA